MLSTLALLGALVGPAQAADAPSAIELHLDASQAPRRLLTARMTIPATPGPMTLYYPRWVPGEHGPTGPISDLSGLKITAAGKPLEWKRDAVELHAFRVTVPEGVKSIDVSMEYLGNSQKSGYSSTSSMTPKLAILSWHTALLYPVGKPARDIQVQATLTLPKGWKLGTALPIDEEKGGRARFKTVSLETLIDSPVLCGEYLKEVRIGPEDGIRHYLVMACDSEGGLALSTELKACYDRLVTEAQALFGARHYRSYRFLLAMSDHITHFGLEHHECSDNRVGERFLLDDNYRKLWTAWLLPHEFVHSWNGKYRRPQGLATGDYQRPMQTRLLWVYEGLTQYLGFVLAARSGLYSPDISRCNLAQIVDEARNTTGRTWRPLEDVTAAAPDIYPARGDWAKRRRKAMDFYDEGALLWLDADTLIREKTKGKRSLDDFCRAFHGGKDGPPEVKTYTMDDVVKTLNGVVEHDWKAFLQRHLATTGREPHEEGLTRSGWRVVYRNKPGDLLSAREKDEKMIDLTSSIGLLLKDDGVVLDVVPGKAADLAGVGPGMKLLAVNDRRWSTERLREGVAGTSEGKAKLRLLLENGDFFRTHALDYAGGERYPHLERRDKTDATDLLREIFRPRTGR